ncbi:MAG: hypothetical protein HXY34_13260 [Candidatus Thorarchaeota archaeon]|nr:hypothetical protein [Candidatus Thorarchaeota archaeon]
MMTLWVVIMLVLPFAFLPNVEAWKAGDEAAVFGHTFSEEYWTNNSILVETGGNNASLTASYVSIGEFQAFMVAFNEIYNQGTRLVLPYQLFGMHYKTPENKEVFIGAIFAFLLAHNESYGANDLPDVGHEAAWYVVPLASGGPWPDVQTEVEPINATKIAEGHYRFGMRYTNLSCRIVDTTGGFWLSLLLPIFEVLISELVIQYDIEVGSAGEIHAETLYTIGQVRRAKLLGFDVDPQDVITDSMRISAVHYLTVFTSKYNVTRSGTGTTVPKPTATMPLSDNITIKVGDNNERAFDIGLGRSYALLNESTTPYSVLSPDETAINCLLEATGGDFLLIAWQLPFSAWVLAHMAYGLSAQLRATYATVNAFANNAATAFGTSDWWYAVTFPEWNGYRVQQDPVYVAYTNVGLLGGSTGGGLGLLVILGLVAVVGLVVITRRKH